VNPTIQVSMNVGKRAGLISSLGTIVRIERAIIPQDFRLPRTGCGCGCFKTYDRSQGGHVPSAVAEALVRIDRGILHPEDRAQCRRKTQSSILFTEFRS
jgi:hypothetical protein